MPETFFIIDAHSHLYQSFHAISGLTSPGGKPVNAVYGFARMLQKIIRNYKPDYLATATDMPGKVFRHELYGDYKATRKPMPDQLVEQIPLAYQMLQHYGIPVLSAERYEADDVMASAARQAKQKGLDAVLVTSDKDVEQLIDGKTRVLHLSRSREVMLDGPGFAAKYGLAPRQLVEMRALAGDSSDNIPGARGIGPKTALKLLERFGSVKALYDSIEKVQCDSLRKRLLENRELVELSRRLSLLKDDLPVKVDFDACRLPDEPPEELRLFFESLGFRSLVNGGAATPKNETRHGESMKKQGLLFPE